MGDGKIKFGLDFENTAAIQKLRELDREKDKLSDGFDDVGRRGTQSIRAWTARLRVCLCRWPVVPR